MWQIIEVQRKVGHIINEELNIVFPFDVWLEMAELYLMFEIYH
jgi:hypothetical protein